MVGWRNFCIEKDKEVIEKLVEIAISKDMGNTEHRDGYFLTELPDYMSRELNPIDEELIQILEESDNRGYYVEANNTSDTGNGLVRFEKGEETFEIDQFKEEDNALEKFNGGMERTSVYIFLKDEGFPITKDYSKL